MYMHVVLSYVHAAGMHATSEIHHSIVHIIICVEDLYYTHVSQYHRYYFLFILSVLSTHKYFYYVCVGLFY